MTEYKVIDANLFETALAIMKQQIAELERLNEEKESIQKAWNTAVGVIKRQDAELERLQNYINRNKSRVDVANEFATRLKAKVNNPECPWEDFPVRESDIDEVLKEMESEQCGQ